VAVDVHKMYTAKSSQLSSAFAGSDRLRNVAINFPDESEYDNEVYW